MAAGTCKGYAERQEKKNRRKGKEREEGAKRQEGNKKREREKRWKLRERERRRGRGNLAEETFSGTERGSGGSLALGGECEEGKKNVLG